jgi:hypothetical protein
LVDPDLSAKSGFGQNFRISDLQGRDLGMDPTTKMLNTYQEKNLFYLNIVILGLIKKN